jgi:hypothetical protein
MKFLKRQTFKRGGFRRMANLNMLYQRWGGGYSFRGVDYWNGGPPPSEVAILFLNVWYSCCNRVGLPEKHEWASKLAKSGNAWEVERERSYLAADWLLRTYVPLWLQSVERFQPYADRLGSLPKVRDQQGVVACLGVLEGIPTRKKRQRPVHADDGAGFAAMHASTIALWDGKSKVWDIPTYSVIPAVSSVQDEFLATVWKDLDWLDLQTPQTKEPYTSIRESALCLVNSMLRCT